jgi:GPH family glycoside/pentoside/hexuronide:cation symporter
MENKKLKFSQLFAYGFFGMFLNTFYLMFLAYYRMFYLTNILQLDTSIAAIVNTLATWGNVVTMLIAGVIIDKINFKSGKYRTWTLVGGIVMAIVLPLLFSNLGLSQAAAGALFVVLFVVQSIGYNCLWVAERSLVGPMSSSTEDANNLGMFAQQGSTLGGIVFGLVYLPILNAFGGSYTLSALLYGCLILVGTIGIFFLAKKYDNAPAKAVEKGPEGPKVTFGDVLKVTGSSLIFFFIAMCLNNAHLGFFMTLLNYFTTYVLNDPAALGLAVTLGSVAQFFGAILSKWVCSKVGKKTAFIWSSLLTGILYMFIAWFGKTSVPFLVIRVAIAAVMVIGGMLIPLFGNDIADYAEMKTGEDVARAKIQGISGTTIRVGSALSATIASFGLAAVGYSATAEVTPQIVSAITNLMAYAPAAVCILSAVAMIPYQISEKELDQFRAEKAAKRAAQE